MRGIIENLKKTEKLHTFTIDGKSCKTVKTKTDVELVEGLHIEFEESVDPGREKDGGGHWPDSYWANKIKIVDEPIPNEPELIGGELKYKDDSPLDKNRFIVRQTCLKCAVDIFNGKPGSIDDIEKLAERFEKWIYRGRG